MDGRASWTLDFFSVLIKLRSTEYCEKSLAILSARVCARDHGRALGDSGTCWYRIGRDRAGIVSSSWILWNNVAYGVRSFTYCSKLLPGVGTVCSHVSLPATDILHRSGCVLAIALPFPIASVDERAFYSLDHKKTSPGPILGSSYVADCNIQGWLMQVSPYEVRLGGPVMCRTVTRVTLHSKIRAGSSFP